MLGVFIGAGGPAGIRKGGELLLGVLWAQGALRTLKVRSIWEPGQQRVLWLSRGVLFGGGCGGFKSVGVILCVLFFEIVRARWGGAWGWRAHSTQGGRGRVLHNW